MSRTNHNSACNIHSRMAITNFPSSRPDKASRNPPQYAEKRVSCLDISFLLHTFFGNRKQMQRSHDFWTTTFFLHFYMFLPLFFFLLDPNAPKLCFLRECFLVTSTYLGSGATVCSVSFRCCLSARQIEVQCALVLAPRRSLWQGDVCVASWTAAKAKRVSCMLLFACENVAFCINVRDFRC